MFWLLGIKKREIGPLRNGIRMNRIGQHCNESRETFYSSRKQVQYEMRVKIETPGTFLGYG